MFPKSIKIDQIDDIKFIKIEKTFPNGGDVNHQQLIAALTSVVLSNKYESTTKSQPDQLMSLNTQNTP